MLLLIADDDHATAQTLGALLQLCIPEPLQVVFAYNGYEAVSAATAVPSPDAVIMDIEMPHMNGFDAAAAIKSALGEAAPTLIAVSGRVERAGLAAKSGAFDHALRKPLDFDELLGLLSSLQSS